MASSFKNASAVVTTANQDVTLYQAANVISSIIHGLYIANKHPSANVQVTLKILDHSTSTDQVILFKVPIPPNTSMSLDKPLNLEVNDSLVFQATNTSTDAFASVLEIT